ncbi:hypothetical protein BIY27_03765 [Gibbsiella quercinecans]|nr:hypothetical protein BIY27_03765 [Gibbsiella quercinecans]
MESPGELRQCHYDTGYKTSFKQIYPPWRWRWENRSLPPFSPAPEPSGTPGNRDAHGTAAPRSASHAPLPGFTRMPAMTIR